MAAIIHNSANEDTTQGPTDGMDKQDVPIHTMYRQEMFIYIQWNVSQS